MKGRGRFFVLALLSLTMFTVVWARVLPATLAGLTASSEVIVVGTVKRVSPDPTGQLVAIVAVDTVWRGKPDSTISISLQTTSACDMSGASAGERAIFFLAREPDGRWHIAHAGYGRMRIVGEKVSVSAMVVLPGDTGRMSFETRQVPFSVMASYIDGSVKQVGR